MGTIRLGHRYKETLSGITGMAQSISRHYTGCDRVTLRLMDMEGKEEHLTYDTTRLKLVPRSKVQDHKPVKSKIKLGEIYQDRSTGIVGHAIVILERLGLSNCLITLEYQDAKTGMPIYANVDEPLLDKVKPAPKAAEETMAKAKRNVKKRGPGPEFGLTGMPVAQGHNEPRL